MDIVSGLDDQRVLLTVLSVWVRGRTCTNSRRRVQKAGQTAVGADDLLRGLQRIALEIHFTAIEDGTFCLDSDACELVLRTSLARLRCPVGRPFFSESSCLFFCLLSGNHNCGAHASNLLIAVYFGDDVVDDVVEGVIEDVTRLDQSESSFSSRMCA